MKAIRFFCLLLCFSWAFTSLHAQKKKVKFGKIALSELEQNTYEADPEAEAVVLYDRGRSYFRYDQNDNRGFVVHFQRHQRIKVLKEAGKEYADFEVLLYRSNNTEERIRSFKAITHCLKDGEHKEFSVNRNIIFNEEVNRNWVRAKFAMPEVQVGSIIEVQYEVESDFAFNLPSWDFQHTIPCVWSEYTVEIPEYFFYNRAMRGYHTDRMTVNESSNKNEQMVFRERVRTNSNNVATSRVDSETMTYQVKVERIVMENVPAFRREVYMLNAVDFLTGIDVELAATDFPGSGYQAYTTDWRELREEMYAIDNLGGRLRKGAWAKEFVQPVVYGAESDEAKMKAVYELVRGSMVWNGTRGITTVDPLRKSFEGGQGSVSAINLTLVVMLEKAGLEAGPVFLSTRSHGRINPIHPSFNDFDYVVAGVKLGEGYVLLDATDRVVPPGTLPVRCLNGQGRWMSSTVNQWVELNPGKGMDNTEQLNLTFTEDLDLEGTYQCMSKGYAAVSARKAILAEDSEEAYGEEWASVIEGMELTGQEITNLKKFNKPLRQKLEFLLEGQVEEGGDLIYFNPLLFLQREENPFKAEERVYPVSFPYPTSSRKIVKVQLPEGYTLDEVPEPFAMALPDGGGSFTYDVKLVNPTTLLVSCNFKLSQLQFLSEEYPIIKEFYDQVILKEATQLVLRPTRP
ncbi:MAG: DUF3857 domain-containing protein [Bacteroidota bacterium]